MPNTINPDGSIRTSFKPDGTPANFVLNGLPRKPGMSRDDLLSANAEIVGRAATETLKHSPEAIYIVLTNPLDTMAYLAMKKTSIRRFRSRSMPAGPILRPS